MRTFHHSAFTAERIAAERARRGVGVTVCLPARECAATVGEIVGRLTGLREAGAIDEILVVDAASPDGTAQVAEQAGAEVFQQAELLPSLRRGARQGRCDVARAPAPARASWCASWTPTPRTSRRISRRASWRRSCCEPDVSFAKAFYRRPLDGRDRGRGGAGEGGGRVNHLMARPALALLTRALAGIRQPLAGEVAARMELL